MGEQLIASAVTVMTALVGLALIAVLVSRQANTAGVISAGGSAFAADLKAAVSPITGGTGLGSFTGGGSTTF